MDEQYPVSLTESQVHQWRDRVAQIDAAIAGLQEEKVQLVRKVNAAMILMDMPPLPKTEEPPAEDIIVDAIRFLGGLGTPSGIRAAIETRAEVGSYAEKLVAGTYFYAALHRLRARGRLRRDEAGYYRLPEAAA